jgi:hypothetical protein
MVAAISFAATSEESGRIRTMIDVLVFATCEIGKNAVASGSSVSEKYFPSATMPTIWIGWPELLLE